MSTPIFKVGQKVRFIRDNSDGGKHYGTKDEIVEIIETNRDRYNRRYSIAFDPPRHGVYVPYARVEDIVPVTPEDPYVDTDF